MYLLSTEEKLMYQVMKAIFEGGIPVSFKGSMVLRACLLETGYTEGMRHTVDIDANWSSDTLPSAEQMTKSLQEALEKGGIALDVTIRRMYGEGRSAGFNLVDKNTGAILFTMDIEVGRPVASTKIYEMEDIRFRGVSPLQMIADKLSVVSSDKVFRRVKDVIDLYYVSKVFDLDKDAVMQTLQDSGRSLGTFHAFLYRIDDLQHAYERFRLTSDVVKPSFDEVYSSVRSFIKDVLPNEKDIRESERGGIDI